MKIVSATEMRTSEFHCNVIPNRLRKNAIHLGFGKGTSSRGCGKTRFRG